MRTIVLFFITCIIAGCSFNPDSQVAEEITPPDLSVNEYGINVEKYHLVNGEIERGDFFGGLMFRLGLSNNAVQGLIEAGKGIFDVTRLRVGNTYEVFYEKKSDDPEAVFDPAAPENIPSFLIYERDKFSNVVFSLRDSLYVKVVEKNVVPRMKFTEVTINTALWNDVLAAGGSPQLTLKLADIYAWSIDFFGLQKGDCFRVMYDEMVHNGEVIGLNHVYYAEFSHDGKVFKAIRFQEDEKGSKYWNEKGESLVKAFLKAPLNFTRISSGFTYARKHPVLKIVRPHTGVDYAAPSGTPVVSIGDGTVISKGWAGGGGNTVKIKHNSVYTTIYMHLRGYAKGLKTGQRVKQGELIGYVGSTGMSTGPHLDFRVHKNGKPINPLTMESPSIEPISKSNMQAFTQTMEGYMHRLDSLDARGHLNKMLEVLK